MILNYFDGFEVILGSGGRSWTVHGPTDRSRTVHGNVHGPFTDCSRTAILEAFLMVLKLFWNYFDDFEAIFMILELFL